MKTPETIQLDAQDQQACIAPGCGALLLTYRAEGRELIYTPPEWIREFPAPLRFGNPILFPNAGQVESYGQLGSYQHHGKTFHIAGHGFARHLPWRVLDITNSSLACELVSTALTQSMFPWEFRVETRWLLGLDGLEIETDITCLGGGAMPVHFGWHPYFRLEEQQSRYMIRVPEAQAVTLFGSKSPPVKPQSRETGLHSSLAQTRLYTGAEIGRCELHHKEKGIIAAVETLSPEFSTWALWAPSQDASYVCLEPWTAPPNALNTPDQLPHIQEGETLSLGIRISPH